MNVIYRITCISNGKFYIGSTINRVKRWARHRRQLRDGTHPNKSMLASWQKYGESFFVFEVIEEVPDAVALFAAEQKYLDIYAGAEDCFNWARYAGAPMRGKKGPETPNYGKPVPPEVRKKISESLSGEKHPLYGKPLPLATREKLRQSNLAYPHKEYRHTEEAKKKISEAGKGRVPSLESRIKRSMTLMGHEVSLDTRVRISKALSGDKNPWYGKKRPEHGAKVSRAVATYREGVLVKTYPSISALRAEFNATPTTVNRLLKSGKPAYGSVFKDLVVAYVDPT
jgi:group I intron endonuclease